MFVTAATVDSATSVKADVPATEGMLGVVLDWRFAIPVSSVIGTAEARLSV